MFKKILIANRGEIVRRIIMACRELDVRSVAVYSDVDADAPWVRLADESYPLPGAAAVETYLNQEVILAIAAQCDADAIHPGYGFLSENPTFATACADRGIVFIGPNPEAMVKMGNKVMARELARQAGVPVVPGIDAAGMDAAALQTAVAKIGFPNLIKASAGGGGKGMRVVWSAAEFAGALRAAQNEARSAFGDDHILIETYFTQIHHVEIQVLADHHGHILHLYERECSIQRRHQKIIEESPAPIVKDDALRQQMAAAAVSLATAVNYTNAGTVEFIVDEQGNFYFLEMNTRLQVEHPVTELVTGLDLAVWQIRIAAGEALPFRQDEIRQRGHAIECRIYAEDPANQFLPSIGEIAYYQRPSGPGIRVDEGIETGSPVTPYYDPLLAKVITWGRDREEAIRKMVTALRETAVLGIITNIPYLLTILQEPAYLSGHIHTDYLAAQLADWSPEPADDEVTWWGAAVFELLGDKSEPQVMLERNDGFGYDPWQDVSGWRNVDVDNNG
jgi:3-methylcrotonyl-CoA carboxylase alpha subunit